MTYQVTLGFDEEAKVYITVSTNVPGLAASAPTIDELLAKVRTMFPVLIKAQQQRAKKAKKSEREMVPLDVLLYHRESLLIPDAA